MAPSYREQPSKIHRGKLKATDHKNIGRLLRACAELEQMLTLYLFQLAKVDASAGTALIGKLPASGRLAIAQKLAPPGSEAAKKLRECFVISHYKEIVDTRNCAAHGAFLGTDDHGSYVFELDTWELDPTDAGYVFSSNSVSVNSAHLLWCANEAEKLIPVVEKTLGLRSLRRRLRERPLLAHPKARNQARGRATP